MFVDVIRDDAFEFNTDALLLLELLVIGFQLCTDLLVRAFRQERS
jgi:hypothetical protein